MKRPTRTRTKPRRHRFARAAGALAVGITVLLVLMLAGCGEGNAGTSAQASGAAGEVHGSLEGGRYRIVTTTAMVRDIVANVVGERGEVINLMGEGVDPHTFSAGRDDVVKLEQADVVFYSGLLLEGRMTDTFVTLARRGKPVFAVTELIDEQYLLEVEGYDGHYDPHVWMDVRAWSRAVEAVANQMSEIDPARAEQYQANAQAYREQFMQLDAYVKDAIASIPESQRVLVTAHDAFGYFGRAYGIEVRGVQGLSTDSEAGTHDINRLVDFIVERQIPAVFVETSVSEKAVRALVEGAGNRGHQVQIGGLLYSDAMGPAGTYEGTYLGMIDHNATTIARALGGSGPDTGWSGRLEHRTAE